MDDPDITLESGKYVLKRKGGRMACLRHGEPWRELTGDHLIGALADRIDTLEKALKLAVPNLHAAVRSYQTYARRAPSLSSPSADALYTTRSRDYEKALVDVGELVEQLWPRNKEAPDGR